MTDPTSPTHARRRRFGWRRVLAAAVSLVVVGALITAAATS
jgi:hypothetical protein